MIPICGSCPSAEKRGGTPARCTRPLRAAVARSGHEDIGIRELSMVDGCNQQHGRSGHLCDRPLPDGTYRDRVGHALRGLLHLDGMAGPLGKLPALLLFRKAMRIWKGARRVLVLHEGNGAVPVRKTDLVAGHCT